MILSIRDLLNRFRRSVLVLFGVVLALSTALPADAVGTNNCNLPDGQCSAATHSAQTNTGFSMPSNTATAEKGRLISLIGVPDDFDLVNNLSFDGANWNLDDTSKPGEVMSLTSRFGIPQVLWAFATAGANPRVLSPSTVLTISTGVISGLGSAGTTTTNAATLGDVLAHSHYAYTGYTAVVASAAKVTFQTFQAAAAGAVKNIGFTSTIAGAGAATYIVDVEDLDNSSAVLCATAATACGSNPTVVTCSSSNTWTAGHRLTLNITTSTCTTNPAGNAAADLQTTP